MGDGGVSRAVTERAVLAYVEALNAGDRDRIAECVSEDFWNEHIVVGSESLRGRAAYRERLATFLATYRNLHYEVEALIVEDERAALAYRMRFEWGDDEGSLTVTTRGLFRFVVRGGLIAHRIDYRDSADARRQMASSHA